jgi:hypothetical protein
MAVPLCWAAIVIGMHGIPGYMIRYQEPWDLLKLDKLAHMGLFGMQFLLTAIALRKQPAYSLPSKKNQLIALVFSLSLGAVLESLQGQLFIDRSTDPIDFVADCIGVMLAWLFYRFIWIRFFQKDLAR